AGVPGPDARSPARLGFGRRRHPAEGRLHSLLPGTGHRARPGGARTGGLRVLRHHPRRVRSAPPMTRDDRPTVAGIADDARNDEEIAALHIMYSVTRDRRLRDELLAHYDHFAVRLGRGFSTLREDADDLVQVARVGLIHALDRFDPSRERPFLAFAHMTIIGELKRHIRDHTWRLRTPRSLQEHYLVMVRTADDLTQELRRSPQIAEIAARSGLTDEQVLET